MSTHSTPRRLALPACALLLALAANGAGASQITGTGIGATNHPTISGTTAAPAKGAKSSKSAPSAASGTRK